MLVGGRPTLCPLNETGLPDVLDRRQTTRQALQAAQREPGRGNRGAQFGFERGELCLQPRGLELHAAKLDFHIGKSRHAGKCCKQRVLGVDGEHTVYEDLEAHGR